MAFIDTTSDRMLGMTEGYPRVDPGVPIIRRQELPAPTGCTAGEANVRPIEGVGTQRSPDPIRQGDTPSRPARMPIVVFSILGPIAANYFGVRIHAPQHTAATPRGLQHPFVERVNIKRPQATAYGSQFVLDPRDQYAIL